MDQSLLEPIKAYFDEYRDKHKELTEKYFDELVEQSGVSAEENAALMAERDKASEKLQKADRSLSRYKGLRVFFIVISVLQVIGGGITLYALWSGERGEQWIGILVAALCVAVAVALIVVTCVVFNKKIKSGSAVVEKYKKQIAKIEKQAWKMMQPLNAKYDWNIPDGLIYQTVPQIQLDKYFDEDKLGYFDAHCALATYDEDSSALCVKSGNSDGRPFLFVRFLRQSMESCTYTGTRVVTWTETVRDSQGTHTELRSETLFATVVKPKPVYYPVTYLFYGCDAAPDLHFDRSPTVPFDADEKKIQSMVKNGEKELEKKTRQAVSGGGSYSKLANSEFEVLFGAANRDNELQFRMMFTPLAQQNMVQLLTDKRAYGDDFYFHKNGAVNAICSSHSAQLDVDANPTGFINYNLAKAREYFIDFNCEYFRSLYFDFAPLFSIPLYTQDPPVDKFGVCQKQGNIGAWEAEAVANHFDTQLLADPLTATDVILKAQTEVGADRTVAHVTAHSFQAVPQIDFVPVWCRNGFTYPVPVPWTQYVPVERTTDIEMQALPVTREQFNNTTKDSSLFVAGIKAKII